MYIMPPKQIDLATRVDELEQQISILGTQKQAIEERVKELQRQRKIPSEHADFILSGELPKAFEKD
jgi:chaperonin cofactor prefoldin